MPVRALEEAPAAGELEQLWDVSRHSSTVDVISCEGVDIPATEVTVSLQVTVVAGDGVSSRPCAEQMRQPSDGFTLATIITSTKLRK